MLGGLWGDTAAFQSPMLLKGTPVSSLVPSKTCMEPILWSAVWSLERIDVCFHLPRKVLELNKLRLHFTVTVRRT